MSQPQYPIEVYQPTQEQVDAYLNALRNGHDDQMAVLRSGMTFKQAKDAVVFIGEERLQRARLEALVPLATVRERMNEIMLTANDAEAPMPLRDALDILGRRDAAWSSKAQVNVTMPTPILDVGAVKAQAAVEAIEGEKVAPAKALEAGD